MTCGVAAVNGNVVDKAAGGALCDLGRRLDSVPEFAPGAAST